MINASSCERYYYHKTAREVENPFLLSRSAEHRCTSVESSFDERRIVVNSGGSSSVARSPLHELCRCGYGTRGPRRTAWGGSGKGIHERSDTDLYIEAGKLRELCAYENLSQEFPFDVAFLDRF